MNKETFLYTLFSILGVGKNVDPVVTEVTNTEAVVFDVSEFTQQHVAHPRSGFRLRTTKQDQHMPPSKGPRTRNR